MLPNYVLPKPVDALKVRLGKNAKYQLVALAIPKGVRVTVNIIPNLKNIGFVDHDLCKFLELEMNRYMTII